MEKLYLLVTIVRALNADCVELRMAEKNMLFVIPVKELRYDPGNKYWVHFR